MTSREGWAAVQIAAKKCGIDTPALPGQGLLITISRTVVAIPHEGWIVTFASKRRLGGPSPQEVYVPDVEVDRALAVDNPYGYAGETATENLEALRKAFGL